MNMKLTKKQGWPLTFCDQLILYTEQHLLHSSCRQTARGSKELKLKPVCVYVGTSQSDWIAARISRLVVVSLS